MRDGRGKIAPSSSAIWTVANMDSVKTCNVSVKMVGQANTAKAGNVTLDVSCTDSVKMAPAYA